MRLFARTVVVLLLVLVLGTGGALAQTSLTVADIEGMLMCQCGCTMVLAVCDCGTAEQMRADIQQRIDSGQSKKEIIDYYVSQYGETVLSAPTKKGFNLVAWVTPFAAVAGGGGLVYGLLKLWARRGARLEQEALASVGSSPEELDDLRQRFQEEFQRYREDRGE